MTDEPTEQKPKRIEEHADKEPIRTPEEVAIERSKLDHFRTTSLKALEGNEGKQAMLARIIAGGPSLSYENFRKMAEPREEPDNARPNPSGRFPS